MLIVVCLYVVHTICVFLHVYMHVCKYVCIYVYMYVCMYVCMYVRFYVYALFIIQTVTSFLTSSSHVEVANKGRGVSM